MERGTVAICDFQDGPGGGAELAQVRCPIALSFLFWLQRGDLSVSLKTKHVYVKRADMLNLLQAVIRE